MTLPQRMRQIRFTRPGGPEVIALEEGMVPQPGAGQLLVKVAYAGINRPDCIQRSGAYPPPPGAPEIPGLEVAGEVVATGADCGKWQVGDRITALVAGGGYAEYCLVDAPLAMPVPESIDLQGAAALPENVLTVYDNIITRGALSAGDDFLVHGGASGIGSIAIQIAKAWGARVITTARGPEKLAFCRKLGADVTIDYSTEDFVKRTLAATDGKGANLILDMVGGDYIGRNLACLAMEGRLVQIAFLKGSKAEFDMRGLMMKRQVLTGSTLRPRSILQKAVIASAVVRDIWPMVSDGRVRPQIDSVFPLSETRKAHERMEASAHSGKIMLKVAD